MGMCAIYKCKMCGKKFQSQEGGGFLFEEFRCENCDEIRRVKVKGKSDRRLIDIESADLCSCGGTFRMGIGPMCQKCKSRDVIVVKELRYYD